MKSIICNYVLYFFSKFIQDKYGYDKQKSAYLAGAVYDVSMVVAPFLGRVIVSTHQTATTKNVLYIDSHINETQNIHLVPDITPT